MGKRHIKSKFKDERENRAPQLIAKTENQKTYLRLLNSKKLVVALGSAGVGKSFCAAANTADDFIKGLVDRIIVARPYVQMGKYSGARPGSDYEKLYPYVRNILDTVKSRIGDGSYDGALGKKIEVQALESIRGRSFDGSVVIICDEMQNSTPDEMKSIITRIGEDAQLVICGDPHQKDIKGESGLEWLCSFILRHNIPDCGIVEFTEEDCVRSGLVADILKGLRVDYESVQW